MRPKSCKKLEEKERNWASEETRSFSSSRPTRHCLSSLPHPFLSCGRHSSIFPSQLGKCMVSVASDRLAGRIWQARRSEGHSPIRFAGKGQHTSSRNTAVLLARHLALEHRPFTPPYPEFWGLNHMLDEIVPCSICSETLSISEQSLWTLSFSRRKETARVEVALYSILFSSKPGPTKHNRFLSPNDEQNTGGGERMP